MISEAAARKIVGQAGAQELVAIVDESWKAYVKEGIARRFTRTQANIVFDYMTANAFNRLAGWGGVRSVPLNGSPVYIIGDRMILRFKKHTRSLLTSNVMTKAQIHLSDQGAFEGLANLPHVTCGYVLDKAGADIEKIVLVRQIKRKVEWSIDLRELATGVLAPATPILPGTGGSAEDLAALPTIAAPAAQRKEEKAD